MITSVLKPVDDVRAFWKIAQSLAKTNKYEINIIGNEGKKESEHEKIQFHAHDIDRTALLKRFLIRYTILLKILKIRPSLLIIATHELLIIGIVAKLLIGCKLIYDVQENYLLNASMNGVIGKIMGQLIRVKERITSTCIDHFWLAEKCYQDELPFVKTRFTIVENKAFEYPIRQSEDQNIKALFSGTISNYAGAKIAMKIMKHLSSNHPDFEGVIIGQIHDSKLKIWLETEASQYPNIELVTSTKPISYDEILERIKWANLGIISYLPNEINENKIPTKLYEYSRYQLPYLVQENTLWSQVGEKLGGAIPMNFNNLNPEDLMEIIKNSTHSFPNVYPKTDTWEHELEKIISSTSTLLSKS